MGLMGPNFKVEMFDGGTADGISRIDQGSLR